MTDQAKDFSPEAVLSAVASELRYNRDDLEVTWDETVTPRVAYVVLGKSNKMRLAVHRSEADAATKFQDIIHENLFSGTFFQEMIMKRLVLDAVVKICNLADLTPYLTMASREGWMLPTGEDDMDGPDIGTAQTIPEIKDYQAALLARWLKDPVAAVWRLQGGDLPSTLAVIVEQCSFDIEALTMAIMTAMGGWRLLAISPVVATTPEGFVIEANNPEAAAYLEELYEATQNELPGVGR
jgi:hypothetical protein